MKKFHHFAALLLFFTGMLISCTVFSQSAEIKRLDAEIFSNNNNEDYEKSLVLIEKFLNQKNITNDDRYYAYLNLSFTHKRLFDYPSVLKNLDNAMHFGRLTGKKEFYSSNIKCQKALAYFDIQDYEKSDELMCGLAAEHYKHIDPEHQAKLIMQQGYLLYLKGNFKESDIKYDLAISKLSQASICDLPMIYGKKLELYGKMKKTNLLQAVYKLSMTKSDSCNIEKYKLYTTEMMSAAYESAGDFENAFRYRMIYDSINDRYNSRQHLSKVIGLEKMFQTQKKQQEINLKNEKLKVSENKILLLVILIVVLLLLTSTYIFWQRQRKLITERKNNLRFAKQLFSKIEEERKRIATDLHDSLGHELLALKTIGNKSSEEKIDIIIDDLRMISRNLHPAMFDQVGFQLSLVNLLERLQSQYSLVITSEIDYRNGLDIEAELQVYRIIQEALSNVIKYSEALAVKVTLRQFQHAVTVQVMDSGKGFDVKSALASGKAFGLESILLRSKSLNGEATINSEDKITLIEIKIPIAR